MSGKENRMYKRKRHLCAVFLEWEEIQGEWIIVCV